jgi:hypothetical protein
MTLQAAYAAPGFSVTDAVGMASRFMLHGSRHLLANGALGALYRATGQDMSIDLNASALSVTVTGQNAAAWGVTVPPGGLTLTGNDTTKQLHSQADIASYATNGQITTVNTTGTTA